MENKTDKQILRALVAVVVVVVVVM